MDRQKLAQKYMPYFMMDKKEPFPIVGIGYTVFTETGRSASCDRILHVDQDAVQCIIEYAVYFDYDIQHLYDLEHVFVYVGKDGEIVDTEASFHGWMLKSMINQDLKIIDRTHPLLYMQGGKHAMMPDPHYFELYPEYITACNVYAGKDGLLVPEMFEKDFSTNPETDRRVEQYIKETYSFVPEKQFVPVERKTEWLMPFSKLREIIVKRIRERLEEIQKM